MHLHLEADGSEPGRKPLVLVALALTYKKKLDRYGAMLPKKEFTEILATQRSEHNCEAVGESGEFVSVKGKLDLIRISIRIGRNADAPGAKGSSSGLGAWSVYLQDAQRSL